MMLPTFPPRVRAVVCSVPPCEVPELLLPGSRTFPESCQWIRINGREKSLESQPFLRLNLGIGAGGILGKVPHFPGTVRGNPGTLPVAPLLFAVAVPTSFRGISATGPADFRDRCGPGPAMRGVFMNNVLEMPCPVPWEGVKLPKGYALTREGNRLQRYGVTLRPGHRKTCHRERKGTDNGQA